MLKKKVFITGAIASLMVFSAAAGGYAATKMKLVIDGKSTALEPKVINGTTYIPLKSVEALGANYKVDAKTGTVTITSKSATSTAPASKVGSSRNTPAPLNTPVTFKTDDILSGTYTAEITLQETIRGDQAAEMLAKANQFNEPATAGYEYMLAKFNFKVLKNTKSDAAVNLNGVQFTLVSSSGKDYETPFVVEPEPALSANLYVGASNSGWVAFMVKKEDKTPLITFGRKYDGTGGAWFKP
ncbi:stalk domain-containing protein [Paenibacillus sp. MMS18-CY102]|uniref:stalk domain-containing protein n=1 Tax=Paenibacillus sp. MMS18-CY102 TaxID=2682849 RepID=UPI0013652217|nr:stalk domain-containing protein [Paenibacillus sp. MMS18-CY102]MWC30403.1 DUF4352 domain-containing protein [Paenibacillus sp. MMS18-CY102]